MKKVIQKSHKSPLSRQERLEKRRKKAVRFFKKGYGVSKVGRILGVSHEAARLWKLSWEKEGIEGLKSKGKPGPKPRLTEKDKERIKRALLKGPHSFGWTTNIWTLKRINEVIKKVANIRFHPCYVWRILQSMGWSCQKPQVKSKYRNEAIIARWKNNIWPEIKKRGSN
jgi:transposase